MLDCDCGTCSKVVSNAGSARTSFLAGRALRMTKVAAASKGDLTVSAVAARGPERPLWLPGSQAPKWLDGRYTFFSLFFWVAFSLLRSSLQAYITPQKITSTLYSTLQFCSRSLQHGIRHACHSIASSYLLTVCLPILFCSLPGDYGFDPLDLGM